MYGQTGHFRRPCDRVKRILSPCRAQEKSFSSTKTVCWEWPVAAQSIIAALTSAGSVVAWQWNRVGTLYRFALVHAISHLEKTAAKDIRE